MSTAKNYEPGKELVEAIDAEGRSLGVVTRQEMRDRRLDHRSTYILVFNRAGELFVHLRTATKDVFPSHWDISVGGVLGAGETLLDGARRELREELGIEAEPEELFTFRYQDERNAVQGNVYRIFHDGPFRLQPEEIVRGEFLPLPKVLLRTKELPFCPDGLALLEEYRRRFPPLAVPKTQRVLLGSGGFRTPERVTSLQETVRNFFGTIDHVLFIPYALKDYEAYVRLLEEKGLSAGYRLDGIHRHADLHQAVRDAQAIYVGGGNTFRLLDTLFRFGLLDLIRERVREGMPYLGISAGTNVACPTIKTTNDMPICQPPNLTALGLVPFQVNPHYFNGKTYIEYAGQLQEHFGETRDDRLREFHEMNAVPVIGLWEGGLVRVENGRVQLLNAAARVFLPGKAPRDWDAGTGLNGPLGFSDSES